MVIELAPPPTKKIDEYDFTFASGFFMPVPVDYEIGDTIQFDDINGVILIHLVAKPSVSDPDKKLPAEDITIFKQHVIAVQHRTRELAKATKDQTTEWIKTLKEYESKVVN